MTGYRSPIVTSGLGLAPLEDKPQAPKQPNAGELWIARVMAVRNGEMSVPAPDEGTSTQMSDAFVAAIREAVQ